MDWINPVFGALGEFVFDPLARRVGISLRRQPVWLRIPLAIGFVLVGLAATLLCAVAIVIAGAVVWGLISAAVRAF